MDRVAAMQAFARVVELESFTKASASLNQPKATISSQIQALESKLGVKLLNRTTRHVSVTPDGAAYYERVVRILSEIEETEAAVSHTRVALRGRLRVDVPTTIGELVLIPVLSEFLERYPDVDLELGCSDRAVDLLQEGIDCVIRGKAITDESLVARRLCDLRIITVASPEYLRRRGKPGSPADLAHHTLIHFFSSLSGRRYAFTFTKDGNTVEVPLQHHLAINDGGAMVKAAEAGIGIVQLPAFMVQAAIASGTLEVVLAEYLLETSSIYVAYPQNRHLSTKVRAFVDWVTDVFARSDLMQGRSSLPRAKTDLVAVSK